MQRTPPTPPPTEERLFTDWSSLESDNQTTQPGSEPVQIAMGNAPQEDINVSSPRTCQQPDELGVRMINMGTNTSDIDIEMGQG